MNGSVTAATHYIFDTLVVQANFKLILLLKNNSFQSHFTYVQAYSQHSSKINTLNHRMFDKLQLLSDAHVCMQQIKSIM